MSTTKEKISLKDAKGENAKAQGAEAPAKKKSKADKATSASVKTKVKKELDRKYLYKDQKTGEAIGEDERKKYRAAARKKADSYLRKLKKEKEPTEHAKLIKFANAWAKKTYSPDALEEYVKKLK